MDVKEGSTDVERKAKILNYSSTLVSRKYATKQRTVPNTRAMIKSTLVAVPVVNNIPVKSNNKANGSKKAGCKA